MIVVIITAVTLIYGFWLSAKYVLRIFGKISEEVYGSDNNNESIS